jgi:hypothetical protein
VSGDWRVSLDRIVRCAERAIGYANRILRGSDVIDDGSCGTAPQDSTRVPPAPNDPARAARRPQHVRRSALDPEQAAALVAMEQAVGQYREVFAALAK